MEQGDSNSDVEKSRKVALITGITGQVCYFYYN